MDLSVYILESQYHEFLAPLETNYLLRLARFPTTRILKQPPKGSQF